MKKSSQIILSAAFLATTAGCIESREWIDGRDEGVAVRDTIVEEVPYRYYRGSWFRIHTNGLIRAPYYMNTWQPGSVHEPVTHNLRGGRPVPSDTHTVRMGGFGRSAHSGGFAAAS